MAEAVESGRWREHVVPGTWSGLVTSPHQRARRSALQSSGMRSGAAGGSDTDLISGWPIRQ